MAGLEPYQAQHVGHGILPTPSDTRPACPTVHPNWAAHWAVANLGVAPLSPSHFAGPLLMLQENQSFKFWIYKLSLPNPAHLSQFSYLKEGLLRREQRIHSKGTNPQPQKANTNQLIACLVWWVMTDPHPWVIHLSALSPLPGLTQTEQKRKISEGCSLSEALKECMPRDKPNGFPFHKENEPLDRIAMVVHFTHPLHRLKMLWFKHAATQTS